MQGQGRRIAITGLGVVAPCGLGKEAYWNGLLGPGLDGVGRSVDIEDWDSTPYYDSPKDARRADGSEQYAIAAATEALAQAGDLALDPARIGTIFGTGVGGIYTLEEQIAVRLDKGERRVSPFLVPMMMSNAPGANVSMRFGLRGPNETITTACAAGTHAIVYAARLIAWGLADAVVTGGTEHAGTPTALASFGNMTALSSTGTSRPFDAERDGFVMGEGSAAFVLEEWEHAVARGATVLGEVLGGGSNADAHHITAPSPGGVGAITCMRLALDDAGIEPGDIKQINAHGTSTPLNDAAEAAAQTAREVFEKGGVGDDLPTLTLSSAEIGDGISAAQLFVRSGLAKSGKDAKRLIAEGGARVDDAPITDPGQMFDLQTLAAPLKLTAGKKRHALVKTG